MVPHHQGAAVMMAQQVLLVHPRAEVADFAKNVITVQSNEIEQMRELLKDY